MKKFLSFIILLIFTTVVFACVAAKDKSINHIGTSQEQNGFDIFSKYSSN